MQIVHDLGEVMNQPDSELQIAGVHVSRTQFNGLYRDMTAALNALHARTGASPNMTDLQKQVVVTQPSQAGGVHTDIHVGKWRQQTTVAIKCLRDVPCYEQRAKDVRNMSVASILQLMGLLDHHQRDKDLQPTAACKYSDPPWCDERVFTSSRDRKFVLMLESCLVSS